MAIEIPTDLTPELVPLSWLIGVWEGSGKLGEGEADDEHFWQQVTFRDTGLPYLEYRSESSHRCRRHPAAPPGRRVRLLVPGPQAGSRRPWPGHDSRRPVPGAALGRRCREAAHRRRFQDPGQHQPSGGLSELYYGVINGPRIQLATEALLRSENSKPYASSTRIYAGGRGPVLALGRLTGR